MSEGLDTDIKNYKACLSCGRLVLDGKDSCENCDWGAEDHAKFLSKSYVGIIALLDPQNSWCAHWLRYGQYEPGLYCIYNHGEVTREVFDYCMKRKPNYLPEWIEDNRNKFEDDKK